MGAHATLSKVLPCHSDHRFSFSKLQVGFSDARSPKHNMHTKRLNYDALVYIINDSNFFLQKVFLLVSR